MRFWNSIVAAPMALMGWPSGVTEAAAVLAPGCSATGFGVSALALEPGPAVLALSQAARVAARTTINAESFVMAASVTSSAVPVPGSESSYGRGGK